jgi:hypothetical protein
MKGHVELLKLRIDGFKPRGLWVCYGHDPLKGWNTWSKAGDTLAFPEIEILPIENINQLDLRFAVGLTVHIASNENITKLKKIHNAFVSAKAKSVFVSSKKCLILPSGSVLDDYVPA